MNVTEIVSWAPVVKEVTVTKPSYVPGVTALFAVIVRTVGAKPDDGVTLSQPEDMADVVKAGLVSLNMFILAVGEGSGEPAIAVSLTIFGEISSVPLPEPIVVSCTGMSSVVLLPCMDRVMVPV